MTTTYRDKRNHDIDVIKNIIKLTRKNKLKWGVLKQKVYPVVVFSCQIKGLFYKIFYDNIIGEYVLIYTLDEQNTYVFDNIYLIAELYKLVFEHYDPKLKFSLIDEEKTDICNMDNKIKYMTIIGAPVDGERLYQQDDNIFINFNYMLDITIDVEKRKIITPTCKCYWKTHYNYKLRDSCVVYLYDQNFKLLKYYYGYVPLNLDFDNKKYNDYLTLDLDSNGKIINWNNEIFNNFEDYKQIKNEGV